MRDLSKVNVVNSVSVVAIALPEVTTAPLLTEHITTSHTPYFDPKFHGPPITTPKGIAIAPLPVAASKEKVHSISTKSASKN